MFYFEKITDNAFAPVRGSQESAGLDLKRCEILLFSKSQTLIIDFTVLTNIQFLQEEIC